MSTRTTLASMLSCAAVIVAVFGAVAGMAPVSAAPAPSGANLHMIQDPANQGNYLLAILGRFPMTQADAVGFLNNINNGNCEGGMFYHIRGDDEGNNDPYVVTKRFLGAHDDDQGYLKATSQGLEYRRQIPLRKNFLDEDRDGVDEIYAQASFLDSDCEIRLQTSQVLTGNF